MCTVLLHFLNRIFHLIWSQKTITKSLIKQGDREFCNLDIKWKVSNKNSSVGLLWNFKEWVTSTEFLFFVNYATMIWLTENKCSIQLKQLFEEHTSKQFMISNEQIKRDNGWTCLKISKLLYFTINGMVFLCFLSTKSNKNLTKHKIQISYTIFEHRFFFLIRLHIFCYFARFFILFFSPMSFLVTLQFSDFPENLRTLSRFTSVFCRKRLVLMYYPCNQDIHHDDNVADNTN